MQTAKVAWLEQQLLQQMELTKASVRAAQAEEQPRSVPAPFWVREDTREAESVERVSKSNKETRRCPDGEAR
jgi:hypothetical protein